MYQGGANLNLDAKGRMTVPTRHRDALQSQCEGRLTLTKHPHGCLLMYPRPVWEANRAKIAEWPMQALAWKRIFLGSAMDVELDSAERSRIRASWTFASCAPECRFAWERSAPEVRKYKPDHPNMSA